MPAPDGPVRVCLETGGHLSFASALDWPGWSRSGRGEEAAVEMLRAYASRYAPVVRAAGVEPPDPARAEVVERLRGSATTDFGVPEAIAEVEAGWELFDQVVAGAPASLRKGPRGGGRDRDAIVDHVVGAEVEMYARKLALRLPRPALDDHAARAAARTAIANALRAAAGSDPYSAGSKGWPPRYAIRRIAWHVLDHAWEVEDRSAPAPGA